jgi:uridylate kinase
MAKFDKADIERRMNGAIEALKHDLAGLRTGRANTALLDPVHVEVYGAMMPLNQVATVSAPEPRMLTVQVWDRANVIPVEKGRVVIFAAGVGAPYFTTDSGAALRAAEMRSDALLKGTSVDGVYDADPKKNANAKRFETVSYDRVLADNLKVMDASAVALCRDNEIPIVVFSIRESGNLARVLAGEGVQTIVQGEA